MFNRNKPKPPPEREGADNQYLKRGTPEYEKQIAEPARRHAEELKKKALLPKPPPPKKNIDLASPVPPGYREDRDGNEIVRLDEAAPRREIEKYAASVLNGAVDAATIATNGTVPQNWKTVAHPELADEFAKTGAMHLVAPDGVEYLAFPDVKVSRGEKVKQAFGLSSKAKAVDTIGRAFNDNHDITFTGHGRGGALAKLGAESASTWLANSGDSIRPKTVVAINATAIPPQTYASLGLAQKNHARTTVNLVNDKDAAARLKGFRDTYNSAHAGPAERSQYVVRERGIFANRIVGGARNNEIRGGTTVGNVKEPKAYPDTLVKFSGEIKFADPGLGYRGGALQALNGDIRHDLARKHLLAASRTQDAGKQKVATRGGRDA